MKRIIIHWTGGKYAPSSTDKEHYHFLVDNYGQVLKGKYAPEDNLDCTDGKYAAHSGGFNTGSIGIAMCSMYGYKNPACTGCYPYLRVQSEACFAYCATLLKKYNLTPSKESVMTHYEVGKMLPNSTSAGKIDISFIPWEPKIVPSNVGDYIRSKVRWYYER